MSNSELVSHLHDNCSGWRESIAIVGIGCRFPGGIVDPLSFWEALREEHQIVGRIPMSRRGGKAPEPGLGLEALEYGGYFDHVDLFDAPFFGVSPREARTMDPQQRLLLEVSWESFEDARIDPRDWKVGRTGVFVGVFGHDYERLLVASRKNTDSLHFSTGNSISMLAGRIAHFFDFRGPSFALDTACSSSLVALHQACQSLLGRETDRALVGGVNLVLSSEISRGFASEGMLSPEGRCRSFDEKANGYVRGEGCAAVLLKRLDDALRDNDRVYAVIKGSAVNQDGGNDSLTAPSQEAQEEVIKEALRRAQLLPEQLSYVEAHGTGTPKGDPVELKALARVFRRKQRSTPLMIGSVKTNLGHTEGAAGLAGLIKAALSLKHRFIPAHLNLDTVRCDVSLDRIPASIPTTGVTLNPSDPDEPFRAGVSSFGFSGTNAHVILEEAPIRSCPKPVDREPHPIMFRISALNKEALKALAERYLSVLPELDDGELGAFCSAAAVGRADLAERLAVSVEDRSALIDALGDFVSEKPSNSGIETGRWRRQLPAGIVFVFGSEPSGNRRTFDSLYRGNARVKELVDTAEERIRKHWKKSLFEDVLKLPQVENEEFKIQCARTYVYQIAVSDYLFQLGVNPEFIVGNELGEYAGAVAAGVLSFEAGLELVATRAELVQNQNCENLSAVVRTDEKTIREGLGRWQEQVTLAEILSSEEQKIQGNSSAVEAVCDEFESDGIQAEIQPTVKTFGMPLDEPGRSKFEDLCRKTEFHLPKRPMISSFAGQLVSNEVTRPDYWSDSSERIIRFYEAVQRTNQPAMGAFVEIGRVNDIALSGLDEQAVIRIRDDDPYLMRVLSRLYTRGGEVMTTDLVDIGRHWDGKLPRYPFQRKAYWFTKDSSPPIESIAPKAGLFFEPTWIPSFMPQTGVSGATVSEIPALLVSALEKADGRCANRDVITNFLEELAVWLIGKTLIALGVPSERGSRFEAVRLCEQAGIQDGFRELIDGYIVRLAECEYFESAGGGAWTVKRKMPSSRPVLPVGVEASEVALESAIIERCGEGLTEILRGRMDPISFLFPEDDRVGLPELYRKSYSFEPMNLVLAAAVDQLIRKAPIDRKIRILEIGAGTGGTTAGLLPRLPADRCEYVFTDISAAFFSKARERFKAWPFVHYKKLNIEESPADQGIEIESFDLVIASNVLHATIDIETTLEHVRELLTPGGALVLLEGIARRNWIELIFGLFDGWRRFRDSNQRAFGPLLSPELWLKVLKNTGFDEMEIILPPGQLNEWSFPQAVVLAQPKIERKQARNWLVLADEVGYGEGLVSALEARGDVCRVVRSGDSAMSSIRQWDPAEGQQVGVIHLWNLDAIDSEDPAPGVDRCREGLAIVQELISRPEHSTPLYIVTPHVVGLAEEEKPEITDLFSSLFWGMGLSLSHEHPGLNHKLLGIGHCDVPDAVEIILSELDSKFDQEECQSVYKGKRRLVPRLSPVSLAPNAPCAISPSATYLVTGGLGGIGREMVQWLAQKGAKSIAIASREPDSDAARKTVTQLLSQGIHVSVFRADLSKKEDVAELIRNLKRELPPLRGILHCAGIFEDRMLQDLEFEVLKRVMDPKVNGAWNLHLASDGMELDFFVLFSSIFSVVGDSGLSNYVMANQFLDSLAAYRRRLGKPALSISWGPWASIGMAGQVDERRLKQWENCGISALSRDTALDSFEQLLNSDAVHVGVVEAEWQKFVRAAPNCRAYLELAAHRVGTERVLDVSSSGASHSDEFSKSLEVLPLARAREKIEAELIVALREILGFERDDEIDRELGFGSLGLDSLASQAFVSRLQTVFARPFDATILSKYSSVEQLTLYLLELVGAEGHQAVELSRSTHHRDGLTPETDDEELIAEELAKLDAVLRRNR